MSALALLFRRTRHSSSPAVEIETTLAAQAVHGTPVFRHNPAGALGYCRPDYHRAGGGSILASRPVDGFDLLFDGRLDNRDDLRRALGSDAPAASATDAELLAAAFARWAEDSLQRILGPFAIAILDWRRWRTILARDPLGDRGLAYRLDSSRLLAATEERALLDRRAAVQSLDTSSLGRYFAALPAAPGHTFFRDVNSLDPGSVLVVDSEHEARRSFVELRAVETAGRSSSELVEELSSALRQAVLCRLEPGEPPAVLMSGGMDSTSIAVVAAELAAEGSAPGPVRSFSWTFDGMPEADERRFMEPVVRRWGLEPTWIPGEDAWPLRDPDLWPVNPNTPVDIPLRWLHESAYRAAEQAGVRTLLTGELGDHLWTGGCDWLLSLLRSGKPLMALAGLAGHFWHQGILREQTHVTLRLALSRLWRSRFPRSPEPASPPEWLTPEASSRLADSLNEDEGTPQSGRLGVLLDPRIPAGLHAERYWTARHGLEISMPFRDRRLLELALGLPAHLMHRPGWGKWALRQAMKDRLPEPTRRRRWMSTQMPVIRRGLLELGLATAWDLLESPEALWRGIVDERWLRANYPRLIRAGDRGTRLIVIWYCIAAELWRRRVLAK